MDEGFRIVSGGTDTHLMLVDVFSKGVRGKEAEKALDARAHHRQQERHPVRRQSAAESQRHPPGQSRPSPRADSAKPEMREVGELIAEVLHHIADDGRHRRGAAESGSADRAVPALHLEARPGSSLSQWRLCTSSSTPGASATSASARTSAAWCRP